MKFGVVLFVFCAFVASALAALSINKQPKPVIIQGGEDPDPEIREKRNFVKQMMKDAWDNYVMWAWEHNELKPVTKTGQSGGIFGDSKIGATIVDSLDTLYIMGLMDEYQAGRDWVDKYLDFSDVKAKVSVFEVNIRFIGGFLSIYALTQDYMYIEKCYQLTKLLLPAFDTPTGIPYRYVNISTGEADNGGPNGQSVLAEFGTLHLEFLYLSEITKDPIFKEKVDKIREVLKNVEKPKGLYWNYMSPDTGEFTDDHVSIGAMGDSFYEYLLKSFLQTGDKEARELYDEAMNGFVDNGLVKTSKQSHLLYIAEQRNGEAQNIVGHLACFAGGMFALGAYSDPRNPNDGNRERDMEIGKNFTNTCRESYIRAATRIGPEVFRFSDQIEAEAEFTNDKGYVLRPEVVESYTVLYRITLNDKYRDWGWDATQAIQKYCKVGLDGGYSGINDVTSLSPTMNDVQETFFLAETLKYLYLLFSTRDLIDIDQWVFNTEAHPLPRKFQNYLY